MPVLIGPTFTTELKAAGVPLDGISWLPETGELRFEDSVSPDTRAQAQAVLTAHNPNTATADQVSAERTRRLALGFNYTFPDDRGAHRFGTTTQDMIGWDEVTKLASAFIAVGTPSAPLALVTNTGPVSLTAMEWQQVLLSAALFREPIWQASFTLQAMSPIPSDYLNDSYWPAVVA
jgi:hypothetical protein